MFPEINPGITWSLVKSGFHKSPIFNSLTQKPAAGRGRSSISLMPYATWGFEVDLNFVPGGESAKYTVLQWFLGCYLKVCGGGGFFYFTDPNDFAVENPDGFDDGDQSLLLNVTPGAAAPMGTVGDGTSTLFQCARSLDGGVDILQNVVVGVITVNGAAVSYSVGTTGVVTFATPPASGAVLSWQGSFRYLCQFTDDTLKDLARVSKNSNGWLWSCSSIAFESVFQR